MTGMEPWLAAGGVWLWESYGKDALSFLVKRLALRAEDLKEAGWEKIDWSLASRTYRQSMTRLYGSMQIFGMNYPVPLGDIFTDVYLLDKPSAWQRHAIEELRVRAQTQANPMNDERRHDGVRLVQMRPRLFILGSPGAGKTTFLKHLVIHAIEGKLDAIPIFVSLKAWSDARVDLMPFLVRQFTICNFPDAQPFVEQILEDGKAIVLFDGLDEVNLEGGERERITRTVREFAHQYSSSRMVITCRTAATEYVFEGFKYCELADFTQKQIEGFVERWFQKDEVKRGAFLEAFAQPNNERLRDLARRPLLLTMLCLTFEETMAFPNRRAELYEEAIDALLKKWDSSRSIQRDLIYRKLSLGNKRRLLMELAAETFEGGEFFMSKRDLSERIARFLQRLPPIDATEDIDGEAVLRSIEAQHGLLIERAWNIYSFSHLTFHEYFTARYILEHIAEGTLERTIAHAADSQWRGVLVLTVSMLDNHNTATFFSIWCRYIQAMIQKDAILPLLIETTADLARAIVPTGSGVRVTLLLFTIVNQCYIEIQKVISELPRLRPRALASELTIAYRGARERALDLERLLVHTLDVNDNLRDRGHDFEAANELSHKLATYLDRAQGLSNRGLEHRLAHADAIAHNIVGALTIARNLMRASNICFQYHPSNRPSATRIIQLVERDRDWQLTSTQFDILQHVAASTHQLAVCLNAATFDNRKSVLDQLFLPPDPSNAMQSLP